MRRILVLLLSLMFLLGGCAKPEKIADGRVYVRNPDCGFYMPVGVTLSKTGIEYPSGTLGERNALLHLRVNLRPYGDGATLTEEALNGLRGLLDTLRDGSLNAIVRFAYDNFSGEADREPPLAKILSHVGQLSAILTDYPDVLTAIEAGMIGPWGEMHTSALADKESFNALISAWLTGTGPAIPVLVRRPKFIADYLGLTTAEFVETTPAPGTEAYRLGVYNDGYLGSETDLGTYADRAREVEWLSRQAAHLPFGGEVTVPGSAYNKIEYAAGEMFLTHTSYLNELWNDKVVAAWKSARYTEAAGPDKAYYGATAYEYIRDHLGYRFTLDEVALPRSAKKTLSLHLTVSSDGFGNLIKPKLCELVFVNDSGEHAVAIDLDPTRWLSGGSYDLSVKADVSSLENGDYTLYLRLREPSSSRPLYAVAFSNGLFDESVLGNRLGKIRIE